VSEENDSELFAGVVSESYKRFLKDSSPHVEGTTASFLFLLSYLDRLELRVQELERGVAKRETPLE
jgi:hypothetical protein